MGEQRIRFDGTVTFGNLLTLASMLCAVIALWRNMETRMVLLEERNRVQEVTLNKVADTVQRMTITQAQLSTLLNQKGAFTE